jgi:hypothetical protein
MEHTFTIEGIEATLKDAYDITYDKDTNTFQIPEDLDVSEDDHIGINELFTVHKKLLDN